MRKEDEISWTKTQMFNALNTYQTGLGEIQQHVDRLAAVAKQQGLSPGMRTFLDQMIETIVSTTVEAAQALQD